MSRWLYPEVIASLTQACNNFLNGEITVQMVQSEIYSAENQIVALDEKWLRSMLFDTENEIELLIYTVDESQLVNAVKPLIQKILDKIV
ncbi:MULTISPECIES: hypothetical protein [Citrobacter freundii complex]|uniref:hypothetical protein n=1 Tax=Citrobacter freundii complex TaxID=1344959 RepID=UPI000EF24292|nr:MULTISPECIES: hypothetical protein [Citrobacter]AYL64890.1 hypothetical protein CUC50_01850 [Citrobacter werkmanii]MBJ8403424.1 hypothetical protein [Citrobacter cronae]MDE9717020.1 hypothetical protein [Citrobacter cronae]